MIKIHQKLAMMSRRFDNINPTMSHDEYERRTGNNDWTPYWKECYQPLYELEYWKIFNKNKTLVYLINDIFNKLDYGKIQSHMKNSGWSWGWQNDGVKEIQSTILDLLIHAINDDGAAINDGGWSTGGFEVKLKRKNNLPISLTVDFGDVSTSTGVAINPIDHQESTITELRKRKLLSIHENV